MSAKLGINRWWCCNTLLACLFLSAPAFSAPDPSQELATLRQQMETLHRAAKFSEELPLAERALTATENSFGPVHPETAKSLRDFGDVYVGSGDYAKAEPLYLRALTICEKALGMEHPTTAASLNKLGELFTLVAAYTKAEPLLKRALYIDEKSLGSEHPDTAQSLNNLATLYKEMGDYTKAQLFAARAFGIVEKTPNADDLHAATIIATQAAIYQATGDTGKAEPLYRRSLKIWETQLGRDHPATAACLDNLGSLYWDMGAFEKAEPLFQRALKIDENVLGPNHPDTALILRHLAALYGVGGAFARAEPLYQRALTIHETALGPNHPRTGDCANDFGLLYKNVGDFAKAVALLERAVKIYEQAVGPDQPSTAICVNNLAAVYKAMGEYEKAESLCQRVLKIFEKTLGPENPDTAVALNNLGILYMDIGDYAKAEPLLQRSVGIHEKSRGLDHSFTAQSLTNLATCYQRLRQYGKAEPLFQRAARIMEKNMGYEHPNTALCIGALASLYREMHDYAKAEPLMLNVLKIDEKVLGPHHPNTALDLLNLALLKHVMGDYMRAQSFYERSLRIDEKTLGSDHPETEKALANFARLSINQGKTAQAIGLALRDAKALQKHFANILSFTSEQQRLAFTKTVEPYKLLATLGRASDLAEVVLRLKGVVLDSLLEDRLVAAALDDPKQRDAVIEARTAKQRLMKLLLEVPKDISEEAGKGRDAEKQALSQRIEELEAGLARQFTGLGKARRAFSVTVAQVQAVMAKDSVLIELLLYNHCLDKDKTESRYGAIVISPDGEPKWVPLGSADKIDHNIRLYQKSARGQTNQATLNGVLKTLNEQIWAPIEKTLSNHTATIIISPDGELNFVSFATLLSPTDRFFAEKYSVRYVASGRDLLRETKASSSEMLLVYANAEFDGKTIAQASNSFSGIAFRSIEMRDLQNLSLPPLPGTETEAKALEKRGSKSVKLFLGANANEEELRRVQAPAVLHLATHGFFLPEMELGNKKNNPSQREQDIPKGKMVNPMHRSGLALSGAQTTLRAWSRGEVPSTENDGIVTAEEVGGLKLEGTHLVVLSACETGSGEARAGEGVMGLRRGFAQAGTQNLFMTLWPISDETTVKIMLDFYDAMDRANTPPQALADTQRDWLVKLRKERGLLAAVQLAGPFIMSSQGKP